MENIARTEQTRPIAANSHDGRSASTRPLSEHASPFEAFAIEADYPPPDASIDPDQSKGWIRRVAPIVLAHRRRFFGSIALALVAMAMQVAIPAVVRSGMDRALPSIVDDGAAPVPTAELMPFAWAVVALGVGRAFLTFLYRHGLYTTAFDIDTDLRGLIYEHLSKLSFTFYDRVPSGQVISRANSDIRSVQMFLTFAPLLTMTSVMFLLALVFMVSVHVPLTIVAVLPLPGVYYLGVRLRNEIFPLSWIVQSRLAGVAQHVDENINGVRVVKSFAAEQTEIEKLAVSATSLRWANIRTIDARARHNPIIENLPRLGQAAVLVYGGWLVIEGQVTPGTLFAFTAYVTMLQVPFRTLGMILMLGQRAKASAGRIYEILDEPIEIQDKPGAIDLIDPQGHIVFDDVHFSYADGESVLDGFSLEIAAGETVALVGRTGCGKSTVARLLARFYEIDEGSITIDDHRIGDLTLSNLRATVGTVMDDPFLFSVSLRDNIAYGRPDADDETVAAAARDAQAHDFISELGDGFDEVVGERGYTLSGGQRQRVAIARVLVVDPPVLVLDDATSAIDVQVEEQIHNALTARMSHRTTIIIAHRLSTIALADRVVLIEDGRVAAHGAHHDLMATEPRYVEVLAQAEGEHDELETAESRGLAS